MSRLADKQICLVVTGGIAALRCVLSLADGARPLTEVLRGAPADAPVLFLSGPEGGLSERDLAAARAAGFTGLRLGPRILRTETAGLAAIAALQALYGDLA